MFLLYDRTKRRKIVMTNKTAEFQYFTGLKRAIFRNVRLCGSWNSQGRYSDIWAESTMSEALGEDGCPIFKASVSLDLVDRDETFKWGVVLDGPQGSNLWGIPTEIKNGNSALRYRRFGLKGEGNSQVERYYLTYGRRLGSQ